MKNSGTVMLAAGGTGGHLYPAEALAQELLGRGHPVVIVTDKRGAAFQKLQAPVECVRAATFRAGIASKIKAALDIGIGIAEAALLLRKYRPGLVVGFGGYPSFPAVFAAQRLGYPTLLHEQNAVLGKANLWLSGKASAIAASLPGTKGVADQPKVTVTGNPVRTAICAVRDRPYAPPRDTFNIFITGGSQGARVFGDIVPEAVKRLPEDLKKRLRVVHQSKEAETAEKYRAAGVAAETKPFFDDMPERLSACHLFIGRSGASTVAEIAVVGRPAIFVPYPGHADQQQKHNAELIAGKGGAWVVSQPDFTAETLVKKLEYLAQNPHILNSAAASAKACGQPEAVKKLADLVEERLKA